MVRWLIFDGCVYGVQWAGQVFALQAFLPVSLSGCWGWRLHGLQSTWGSMKVGSKRSPVCSLKIHWSTYQNHSFRTVWLGRNGGQGGKSGKSVGNLDFQVPQFVVFNRDNLSVSKKMGAAGPHTGHTYVCRYWWYQGGDNHLRKHSLFGEEFWFPDESSRALHPCHQVSSDQFTLIYLSLGFVREGDTTTIYYPICTRVISYVHISSRFVGILLNQPALHVSNHTEIAQKLHNFPQKGDISDISPKLYKNRGTLPEKWRVFSWSFQPTVE